MDVRRVRPDAVELIRRATLSLALGTIGLYRCLISPLFPRCCRFAPSCSDYAAQALRKHGLLRGLRLTARRILRCHPLGGSGFDPVP
jgi:putative membrane protein insertion efficiency factor